MTCLDPADLVSAREAADLLGVSLITITRLIKRRELIPLHVEPYIFDRRDVDRIKETRKK